MPSAPRLVRLGASAVAAGLLLAPVVLLAPAGAAPSPHGSCADVAAAAPGSPDGEYEITSYGRTLSVWCADMATTPVEYLTLQRGGPGVNVATSNNNWSPYVETQYTRIGLNLPTSVAGTFTFRPADGRFSTTTGGVGPVEYGTGGSCGFAPGPFNIDLRGTPFAIGPDALVDTGWMGHGDVTSTDGQQVLASPNARGDCGGLRVRAPYALNWIEAVEPVVGTSPADTSVVSGDDAVFTASSTGGPGTSVVWQTSPDGTTWTAVPGATGDTLTLTHVTRSMDGLLVRATYSNGEGTATTTTATLSVAAVAPGVTAPVDATVASGADAVFSVTVTGDPAPSLQWELSDDAGTTWTDVPGATDAELTLEDVTTEQDGLLVRLRAENEQGTTTSASAELTVQALAPTVSAPADVTVAAGSDATVSVTVTGDPAPTVRWELSPDGTTWVDSGLEGETTVLTEVPHLADGWLFRAVAESAAGTAVSSPATLTVTALAPVVVSAPEAVTVDAGEDAAFAVEATGDPEPDVQWQVSTDGQEWTDVAGETGWSLVLEDVSADDHGLLVRAVLANEGGTVATDGVALTVVSPPAASPVTAVPAAAARAVVGALPRTGTEPVGVAVLGGLMVLGGGLITVAARRRVTAR